MATEIQVVSFFRGGKKRWGLQTNDGTLLPKEIRAPKAWNSWFEAMDAAVSCNRHYHIDLTERNL